jgi:predicted nucleotidyltransferase
LSLLELLRQRVGRAQAESAAALLKEQFSVKEVVLFGSLLSPESVHPDSDIDLAIWELPCDRIPKQPRSLLFHQGRSWFHPAQWALVFPN